MNWVLVRTQRDEQGVALVLALAFLVLIGVVTSALLASLTSSVDQRVLLDQVRNKQYAADAAIEQSIAAVRGLGSPGAGLVPCGPYTYAGANTVDNVPIHVDCTPVPRSVGAYLQRNVVLTSCIDTGVACTDATTIVRAQVNYEANTIANPTITKTYVQSWTVTR